MGIVEILWNRFKKGEQMKELDKKKFKGDKDKTHTDKVSDHFEETNDDAEEVYDFLNKNCSPTMHYKNGAVVEYAGNNGYGYRGRRIEYSDGYARIEFVDSFGDELVEENGELLRGECAGHLKVEVWGNEFGLNIETASGTIVEMTNMDIRLLKKLNNFLNYALNDRLLQTEESNDTED